MRDLDARQLRWWAWYLCKGESTKEAPISFVELLPADPSPEAATPELVELILADGRVLRFSASIDGSTSRARAAS